MSHCFRELSDREKELKVESVQESTFRSKRDGCPVTLVECEECEKMFEDLPDAVIEKIVYGDPLLCLVCDPNAFDLSFVGITIQFGWQRE